MLRLRYREPHKCIASPASLEYTRREMKVASASIHITEKKNGIGVIESRIFDWDGSRNALAKLSREFVEEKLLKTLGVGEVVVLGALRLRVIQYCFWEDAYEVMLDGWRAYLRQHGMPLFYGAVKFYHRLIITAAVWNLANRHSHCVPTFSDLRIVQWCKRTLARIKRHVSEISA